MLALSRARAVVAREVDADLGTFHGLGLNDLAVLLELRAAPQGRMRRADLAQRLAVTPSGIARQVAPLERIGLVARESNPADARLALVVLTPTGERIAAEALATGEATAARALGRVWTTDERQQLGALLGRAAADAPAR